MMQSTQKSDALALQVKATGVYAYQFTEEQQHRLIASITGKSKKEATALLLQTRGVQSVAITLKNNTTVLPTDANAIHLTFLVTLREQRGER